MSGPVVHFVVLKSFNEVVNGHLNRYVEGRHYHAREGDTWDDLRSKIPVWEKRKLIAVGLEASTEVLPLIGGISKVIARGRASVGKAK